MRTIPAPNETGKALRARLRVCTPAELVYRAWTAVRSWLAQYAVRCGIDPAPPPRIPHESWRSLSLPPLFLSPEPSALKRILRGERFTLNCSSVEIGRFEDEVRGRPTLQVPMGDAVVDIRAVWEPARLQHVTTVMAHLLAGSLPDETFPEPLRQGDRMELEKELKTFVRESVLGWIEANPFLRGPHYLSAMECGLRIPVFLYALQFIEGPGAAAAQERILEAIYRHAWWIARRLSLHASLGNHTICECVGLIFAGAVFRRNPQGRSWLKGGLSLLEQEVAHQILDDGGPAEQSLNYHRFVLDLSRLALNFLEADGQCPPPIIRQRIEAGESFQAAFRSSSGEVPQIGDSDDGFALAPAVHPGRNGAAASDAPCALFHSSGYTVFRGVQDSLLTFDHGPLGLPHLYNHGHADALSITLGVSGKLMIVDSGTYRYNAERRWRRYFKGTRAHSTVTVDGVDQAVQETSFIWSRPYNVKLIRHAVYREGCVVEAEHDGYTRLKGRVRHRRSVVFWRGRAACLQDTFRGGGEHVFELNLHVHPEVVVARGSPWWTIQRGESRVLVNILSGGDLRLVWGGMDPPLGWYSDAYGVKRSCGVLQVVQNGTPDRVRFVTVLAWADPPTEAELDALLDFERNVLDGG